MSNELQFRISSGLKNIIGRELITDDFIAIFELVKNSFDAHATNVDIIFEDSLGDNPSIKIVDNGKGMNYDDIINKWLFVAYSAKKEGVEDVDYRDKIQAKTYYAGAKGIGRFSCDKLGSKLCLITTKDEENTSTEQIDVDWSKFEVDSQEEFVDINVNHQTLDSNPSKYKSGTILEITGLRNDSIWDEDKLLRLKRSLAKLINPFDDSRKSQFHIKIQAKDFIEYDSRQSNNNLKINGFVENNLLEILNLKAAKIKATISNDGKSISYELSNNATWLYKIKEVNNEFNLLNNILFELYYLDRRAKNNFTRLMGIRAGDYGSVFLFKNGFRIYPYGEPGDDSFSLDKRQQKRLGDYIGTGDLIGRIEIFGNNEDFKETTSRGDGLIKNVAYEQLQAFLINKVITKLEGFRKNIYKYGIDLEVFEQTQQSKEKIVKMLADISSNDYIEEIEFNNNLIEIIESTQHESDNATTLLKSIERIARNSQNEELVDKIKKIKTTLDDAITIADLAEEELREKDKEIKETSSQNLFLKSLKSQDFKDIVNLMHHIGISSGVISYNLKTLTYKIDKNIPISNDDLRRYVSSINQENHKILSISRFATKTNFKMNSENQFLNLSEFISEYVQNIAQSFIDDLSITVDYSDTDKFLTTFKPIEMTIVIDNLISNSRKAKSKNLYIELKVLNNNLIIIFKDDGVGIPNTIQHKIFDFGFTNTGGSGLGLSDVKEILGKMNASIINENIKPGETGAKFVITVKK